MTASELNQIEFSVLAAQLRDIANLLSEMTSENSERHSNLNNMAKFQSEKRRFESDGEYVDLTLTESLILDLLVQNIDNPVDIRTICGILNLDYQSQRQNVKSYVYRLKRKIQTLQNASIELQTVRGLGYRAQSTGKRNVA